MSGDSSTPITLSLGGADLRLAEVCRIARGQARVALSDDPAWVARVQGSAALLTRLLRDNGVVYGVTTGYGDSCTVGIHPPLVLDLPRQLVRFHGCGLGRVLPPASGLAVLAVRLASLARGYSGVRLELLQLLADLINHQIVPVIPEEGSVGASGDLTPLSYVAAVLIGEREVWYRGERRPAAEVLAEAGLKPLTLLPKEGLALMNGTSVMTALACLAWQRAEYLMRLCARLSAGTVFALQGNPGHYSQRLFELKPHPGQARVAAWIRQDLGSWAGSEHRLQDRYSTRCAPHVIGVLADALPWFRQVIEIEINSVNDNPVVDGETQQILHGGHFYGGHIAFVMDSLKALVANLADLLDRQLAQLVDPKSNHGLPANLSGATGERRVINHGFKAVQIAVSAWTAEALKLTMPASVFSRSTECHNQDKVSMGTIAARDCLRVLELTEQVAAAHLLAVTQGVALRVAAGEACEAAPGVAALRGMLAPFSEPLGEDRPLEADLRRLIALIQDQHWELYDEPLT